VLLESLEGKRGQIRPKPPCRHRGPVRQADGGQQRHLAATVPIVMDKGAAYYRDFGMGRSRGTLTIQLAGNIKYAGWWKKPSALRCVKRSSILAAAQPPAELSEPVQVGGPLGGLFPGSASRHAAPITKLRGAAGTVGHGRHRGI